MLESYKTSCRSKIVLNYVSIAEYPQKATTLIDVKLESGIIDASEPPPEYNSNAT